MQVIVQVLGVPTFPSRSPTRWSRFRLAHFVADGRIGSSNVENPRASRSSLLAFAPLSKPRILRRIRLTNRTCHFAAEFAEVGG
jgi:hypothetical protein